MARAARKRTKPRNPKSGPKGGRPSVYDEKQANLILFMLAEGMTLRAICKLDDMPLQSTVRAWVMSDRDGFEARYRLAREIGYHAMADEVVDIADGPGDPQNKRIRFDARRWLLSKALPKIYGDKISQEITGAGGAPIETITRIELVPLKPLPTE